MFRDAASRVGFPICRCSAGLAMHEVGEACPPDWRSKLQVFRGVGLSLLANTPCIAIFAIAKLLADLIA